MAFEYQRCATIEIERSSGRSKSSSSGFEKERTPEMDDWLEKELDNFFKSTFEADIVTEVKLQLLYFVILSLPTDTADKVPYALASEADMGTILKLK